MKYNSIGDCTIEIMQAMYAYCKMTKHEKDMSLMNIYTYEVYENKKSSSTLNCEDFQEEDTKQIKRVRVL
jgi:hypothetical protein